MKATQLLKGVLEGCVLLVVLEDEVYGYELVQKLKTYGFTEIVAGTVYPLLQKLEKQGYLNSMMRHSPDGPDRKYYRITPQGRIHCAEFIDQWARLTTNVDHLITRNGGYIDEEKE
ncbi:PadR family transcriptional regulator [Sporolactobacillus shoreae]|uniref:PadR family transcriptional regulator n=1 Tax=Sporolactobacillus shoreae TaxID=1465501 RepID=A0A4Z0GRJ3_9BACL|nr:PadR family transcriptional regulator [Sporolactobacillus shoreae]TGA99046.1 PadR family transcriptional regulator [Sporolactobacillus shoreae]